MKKLVFTLSVAILAIFSKAIFAAEKISRPFTIDYSQVQVIVGENVDWNFYNSWYLASELKVNTALSAGWGGVQLQELTTAPYVDHNGMNGNYATVQHVGLTRDAGATFAPATPSSCLVNLRAFDVLHVSGILHIPGNNKTPYIENLNCHLN